MIDMTSIMAKKKVLGNLYLKIGELTKDATALEQQIVAECPHPVEKIDSDYVSGGYDYVSSVVITHTCIICEKVLKSYNDPKHKGRHG